MGHGDESGFSLIEALVALLILAITTVGLIRAAEAHVDSIRGLERRAAAQFVAENRMVEARLGIPAADEAPMLGTIWRARVEERGTDDPDLRAVTVTVAQAGARDPMVTLEGFRDAGTTTVRR